MTVLVIWRQGQVPRDLATFSEVVFLHTVGVTLSTSQKCVCVRACLRACLRVCNNLVVLVAQTNKQPLKTDYASTNGPDQRFAKVCSRNMSRSYRVGHKRNLTDDYKQSHDAVVSNS